MITDIGIMAGEIWQLLDQQEEIKLSELVAKVNQEQEIVLMSLGWLAREGHVVLSRIDRDSQYKISLRKK